MKFTVFCLFVLCSSIPLCTGQRGAKSGSNCDKPPSGPWLVTESRPSPDGGPATEGRSVLFLVEDSEVPNAYSGDGSTVYYASDGTSPTGEVRPLHAALVFNAETCVATGVIYNLAKGDPLFADAVRWTYDGEKFEGTAARTEGIPDSDVRLLVPPFSTFELTQLS